MNEWGTLRTGLQHTIDIVRTTIDYVAAEVIPGSYSGNTLYPVGLFGASVHVNGRRLTLVHLSVQPEPFLWLRSSK